MKMMNIKVVVMIALAVLAMSEVALCQNNNTIYGEGSGNTSVTGSNNSIYGRYAGINITKALQNVIIGEQSGNGITESRNNVYIGRKAATMNTGSANIFIGAHCGAEVENESNILRIANNPYQTLIVGDFLEQRIGIGFDNNDDLSEVLTHTLNVNGKIHSQGVKVDLNFPAPDYVFDEAYELKSLTELENYIKENNHLPEIPSAAEMEKDGVELLKMSMMLLEKVEELTLYTLEQEKRLNEQSLQLEQFRALLADDEQASK